MNHQTLFSHFLQDIKVYNNWNYSFECNSSFFYISLLFSHIYFVLFQQFLGSESSDSLIFFGLSEVLIFEFLSYFFAASKIVWQIFFKSLQVQAIASLSNCNTNWNHTRANHAML